MNSVLKFIVKLQTDAGNLMVEARKVTGQLDAIQQKATSVGASIKRAFSPSNLGSSLMSIPGMQFLTNPYTLMATGIGAVTKLGAEAEMTATAFSTLVGSEEKAKGILGDISKFAAESPFGKLDLTSNAQQMLSFGVSTDKVMGYLRQLGDISGGNKEKLSSLSLVMGQVSASGKLMGQDLMQFINAGFNPLKELQKMYPKKTYEELQEAMSKGAITADMVASAIEHATSEGGQFYRMMEKTSQTIAGRWSSVMDSLQEMAVELFEEIKPYVSKFIEIFEKSIPYISKTLKGFFFALVSVICFVKDWWKELALVGAIIGIVTIALTAKSLALTTYAGVVNVATLAVFKLEAMQRLLHITMIANPVGAFIAIIAVLIAAIVYCWNRFAGFRAFLITAWDTFKQLGTVIKDYVINRINELLSGIGKVGKALKLLLAGEFSQAWDTFKDGVVEIHGVKSARQMAEQTGNAVGQIVGNWQKNYAQESKKQDDGVTTPKIPEISTPALKGSAPLADIDFSGGKGKKDKGAKTAEAIATGGTRPTNINISISKLIETLAVSMMDKADTHEIERVVLQAMNRSLAIATSSE